MKDARKRQVDDGMNVVREWKVMAKENLWSGLNQVRQREQDQSGYQVPRESGTRKWQDFVNTSRLMTRWTEFQDEMRYVVGWWCTSTLTKKKTRGASFMAKCGRTPARLSIFTGAARSEGNTLRTAPRTTLHLVAVLQQPDHPLAPPPTHTLPTGKNIAGRSIQRPTVCVVWVLVCCAVLCCVVVCCDLMQCVFVYLLIQFHFF